MSDENENEPIDPKDAAHWDAVEEAGELLNEERFHEALVVLREIIKADPTNPYAFYFLGIALYEVGELEPARDAYRACLRVAPKHLGARVALVHVMRQLGDLREALKEGAIALEQAPTDGEVLHAIGLIHLARGDGHAARRHLEAFLATKPEFEIATEVRGLLATMDAEPPTGGESN